MMWQGLVVVDGCEGSSRFWTRRSCGLARSCAVAAYEFYRGGGSAGGG